MNDKPTCFATMPISTPKEYQAEHFKVVCESSIKPACVKAGFAPIRADEVDEWFDRET